MTLKDAMKFFKTKTALAKALGISKQAVSNWGDENIPEAQELKLRHEIIPALKLSEREDTAA